MARHTISFACVTAAALSVCCLVYCVAASGQISSSSQHHALVGELEKVDTDTKKITVRAADGSEHAVSYGGRTIVHGLAATAKGADLAGKEGSQVVVRYTGAAGRETAEHIGVFGHDALKSTEGTITHVDHAGHTVAVKTSDGAEETYDMGRDSAVDTEHGLVDAAHFTGKEGDHVIVYHTEQGGRKVVHLLKRL